MLSSLNKNESIAGEWRCSEDTFIITLFIFFNANEGIVKNGNNCFCKFGTYNKKRNKHSPICPVLSVSRYIVSPI